MAEPVREKDEKGSIFDHKDWQMRRNERFLGKGLFVSMVTQLIHTCKIVYDFYSGWILLLIVSESWRCCSKCFDTKMQCMICIYLLLCWTERLRSSKWRNSAAESCWGRVRLWIFTVSANISQSSWSTRGSPEKITLTQIRMDIVKKNSLFWLGGEMPLGPWPAIPGNALEINKPHPIVWFKPAPKNTTLLTQILVGRFLISTETARSPKLSPWRWANGPETMGGGICLHETENWAIGQSTESTVLYSNSPPFHHFPGALP